MNILFALVVLTVIYWTAFGVEVVVQVRKDKVAAQRAAERLKMARLRRHADEEDELIRKDDMAGVYGEYSPPPAVRGVGIYLTGGGR